MGSVGILDRLNGLRMDNGWQQDGLRMDNGWQQDYLLFVEYLVVT